MKILVLGASSLIGSHVYAGLKSEKRYTLVGTQCKSNYPEFQRLDVTQPRALETFLEHNISDVIVNSIGIVGKEACRKSPELAFEINSKAVETLSYICKKHNLRLIHLSTIAVHDGNKQDRYIEQDAPTLIHGNVYNITKVAAEASAQNVKDHLILRIGDTYGHAFDEPARMGGSIFKWAYETLQAGKEVPAFAGLRTNQTYLPDIGNAVRYLLEKGHQGILNLGGEEIEVAEFFNRMKSIFNLPGSVSRKQPPPDYQGNRALDLSLMRSLNISMHPIDEGLEALVPAYKLA
ncbi:MAG: sugar nucleotide-binding protein [Nanoarchaeota archaeon]